MLLDGLASQFRRDAVHHLIDLGRQLRHGILDRIPCQAHDIADGHPFDLIDLFLELAEETRPTRSSEWAGAGSGGVKTAVAALLGK